MNDIVSGHDTSYWYAQTPDEVLRTINTSQQGLSQHEAKNRLDRYGPNSVKKGKETSIWQILRHQITSPLIYVLLAALGITLAIDQRSDAIVIGIVLGVNTVIGFFQEYRAENAMQALMKLASPKAMVRRDGKRDRIDSDKLVPGDIVFMEAGSIVPADLRIIEANRLQINESLLTGESVPSAKFVEKINQENVPLADQENMAFMSTAVTAGNGTGVVVATGQSSQMGLIAEDIMQTKRAESPLQTRMKRFSQRITFAIVGVSGAAFAIGVLAIGRNLREMFLLAVGLAVAAIPEGLPVVMTVALAVGLQRMAGRNAIIRRLPAAETLGSCTIIMSDKTGTLTRNEMIVQEIWSGDELYAVEKNAFYLKQNGDNRVIDTKENRPLKQTLIAGVLANQASLRRESDKNIVHGDPTETALLLSGSTAEIYREDLMEDYPVIEEIPFDPNKRYSATIFAEKEGEKAFLKGAPERIISASNTYLTNGGEKDIDRKMLSKQAEAMAKRGMRVLAMAVAANEQAVNSLRDGDPKNLTLLGLQAMIDPPRSDAIEAVKKCHRAGIRVAMVTGDNPVTAVAVANKVGITDNNEVVTGVDLDKMSDQELEGKLRSTLVYARVSPNQKLRLVNTLRGLGEIVAVTGDGVNDAPALKSAHIGTAMGEKGTDVAKEASDIVLTDDNFASIYAAVEEGRTAFSNIRKAAFFLISPAVGEVIVILVSLAMRLPLPLLPAQILWINVVTNGIQDVALAFEPGEKEQFQRPPRDPKEGILSRLLVERTFIAAGVMAAGTLGIFLLERGGGASIEYARVATVTTFVIFQIFHVFNCRSVHRSAFRKNPLSNKILFIGTLSSLGVHIAAMYFDPIRSLLHLQPLSQDSWMRIIPICLAIFGAMELHKRFRQRGSSYALKRLDDNLEE